MHIRPTEGDHIDHCEVAHDARIVHPHGQGRMSFHGHSHLRTSDRRKLLVTIGVTAVVLVLELVGGWMSHSLALLSDAGHMLVDLSAQLLSLLAIVFAVRPADARRTYGYYRLEILAALANGVALVVLAVYLMVEAVQRLHSPVEVRTGIMLVVAAIGLVTNILAAYLLSHASTMNVRGAYLHALSDTLSSVGVLVGGVILLMWPSWSFVDPILGFLIGAIVVANAYRLIRDAADVLLEAVPNDIDLERVRQDVRGLDGIEDVHDLHIWTITSGLHALSAHLVVQDTTLMSANDELLTRVKALLLERHQIAHSTLQIESHKYEHVSHIH